MSSEGWKSCKLEDVLETIIDYRGKTPIKVDSGIPLITAKIVKNGFIQEPNEFIAEEDYDSWMTRGLPKCGDVVLTTEAPLGEVAQITNEMVALAQRIVTLRGKAGVLDNAYLKYYLYSEIGQRRLIERETGTTVTGIKQSELRLVKIDFPPFHTQRSIAEILSALDDKIELNRQTNATLDAIAQSIFKEWFVDFNFPGATGEMVESELGMIPKGWKADSILVVADLLSGGTPSTRINEYWDGDIKWISAKDVSNSQGSFVLDTERKITRLGVKNSSSKILPKLTTIVTARGTVGSYCILSDPMAMNQTNYGLKAKEQESDYFVFFSLANLITQLQQAAYGTIFDTVTTITFEKSKIIVPPHIIIQKFDQVVSPLMGTILHNLEQSNTLSKIRDLILPKLMNGEIRV